MGRANCPRLPSMACTLVPPCTSLCPSSGWGCSRPDWGLCVRWPGCCRQSSACRGTVHCSVSAGPATGLGRRRQLPSALWLCPQRPDLHHWSCFLSRHRSAAWQNYPALRCSLQSCPWVMPWTENSTQIRVLQRRWWTGVTVSWWRSSGRCKALASWMSFFTELLLRCSDSKIVSSTFISFALDCPRQIVFHHSFSCCV